MKITDAYWEERNLGLKVCELIFEPGDTIDYNKLSELEKSYDYLVAKIPGNKTELVHAMEETGFRYLENQQTIYFETGQLLKIDGSWKNRFREIQCERVSERNILENICEKIRGGLYVNGRISADPLISMGISDIRIANWLTDLFSKSSASVYALRKKDSITGYFVLDDLGDNHLNIVQAGIFREFQNKGYSFLLLLYIMKTAFENNFTGIFASISANNIKTINSISKFVYVSFKGSYVVLRKMTNHKS